jgi:tetratricopeptide (TPR) repeat protein
LRDIFDILAKQRPALVGAARHRRLRHGDRRCTGAPLSDRAEELFQRALHWHQKGLLAEAERLYREVLRLDPGRLGALNNLGNVLQSLGRLTEAENCYRDVLAREPQAPEALYNLGATLRKLGREDEAHAREAELVTVLLAIGDAAALEGNPAEAADCYQRALELRPDDAAIRKQLEAIRGARDRPV